MRVVDLSFPIRPHFRWKVAADLRSAHARGDLFQSTVLTIGCHAYTHVDAPVHFLPAGRDIARMPVDQWVGEAAVVDLTHLGENGEVTAEDLELHARHVRAEDIVLLRTDWPRKCRVEMERFWSHAPYTGASATHEIFFPAGITVIEYLTNLDQIGADRCRFVALPLAIEGADGSPVRAIAMVE